jgi:hypothetical protein
MSYATRNCLSHTVFWRVLENNSMNQGCFEFWSKYASGNIQGNFPNASNPRKPTRRLTEESRSKNPWKINVNRVRSLVRTVKLPFSEHLLKVEPLKCKLMSPSRIAYLSEICRIIHVYKKYVAFSNVLLRTGIWNQDLPNMKQVWNSIEPHIESKWLKKC